MKKLILIYPLLIILACGNSDISNKKKDDSLEVKEESPKEVIIDPDKVKKKSDKEVGYITNAHLDMGDGTYMEVLAFEKYGKRGKGNRLGHGIKVYIIERSGDEILVETDDGIGGWVSEWAVVNKKPKPLK